MLLYQNGLIKLDYDPGKDILCVQYPDLHEYLLPEISHSVNVIVETVRNYDIKSLLLDGRQTIVTTPPEYGREIALQLAAGLARTRLQKLARLESFNPEVEKRAVANVQAVQTKIAPPFELKNFTDEDQARAWLSTEKNLSNVSGLAPL